jgi:hypothetical protein
MGVLDNVIQMKRQGYTDSQIIAQLREQGISPKEINDALSHSEIKNAISRTDEDILSAPPIPNIGGETYSPQAEETYASQPQQQQQGQEYYPQEGYSSQEYSSAGGLSTDTIVEISEQVFEEKAKKMQRSMDELNEFKSLSQIKIDNALDRLKKIEAIIDKLQISILEKVGSYGSNIDGIRKEMSMMQDSFGKMVGRMAERPKEARPKK